MLAELPRAKPMSRNIVSPRRQLTPSRLTRAGGFTLIELLVTVALLFLLVALLLPAAARVRESSRRAVDLSNLHQLSLACAIYASDNEGALPPGRIDSAPVGADDYTWTSYAHCWKPLVQRIPALAANVSCVSVSEGNVDAADYGIPDPAYGSPDDVKLGWMYWGARDDLHIAGSLRYRSLRRLSQRLTPGSQTLWTCLCWDSAGQPATSYCPHVGSRFLEYPAGVTLQPPPDGLGVALIDGTASFVPWNELVTIVQANGFKIYFQP